MIFLIKNSDYSPAESQSPINQLAQIRIQLEKPNSTTSSRKNATLKSGNKSLEKLNWQPIEKFDRLNKKLEIKKSENNQVRPITNYSNPDVDDVYGTINGGSAAAKPIKVPKFSYRSSS